MAVARPYQAALPLVIGGGSNGSVTPSTASLEQDVVTLINAQRSAVGCPALTIAPQLSQAAQAHALDMANNDFFDHVGSDGSDVGVRVDRTGYNWQVVAENLSSGRSTAAEAVAGWLTSPGHRANILDCSTRETGVGFVYLANDGGTAPWHYYWVQVFAAR
jgi:uncharacterized protein YkwD